MSAVSAWIVWLFLLGFGPVMVRCLVGFRLTFSVTFARLSVPRFIRQVERLSFWIGLRRLGESATRDPDDRPNRSELRRGWCLISLALVTDQLLPRRWVAA